jgi:phosphoribosyl 1,2-cyclic phosphodiesterase
MTLRFWGVRGSTPTPVRENLRYGGNTPCIELRAGGELFILDCGTGLRRLGNALRQEFGRRPIRAQVFLSHYHWDHIQGIPFFTPLYDPKNSFVFHSFKSPETDVQRALEHQMNNPYFPVDMRAMRAKRSFREIEEQSGRFGSLLITTRRLNHPQGCLGFRIEHRGRTITYATDNEPGDPRGDQNVRALAEGADVLIYDAQYTPQEYRNGKQGWGHSTWEEAVRIAREAGVKKLVLFHHDPDHDDKQIDAIVRQAQRRFAASIAAREGLAMSFK